MSARGTVIAAIAVSASLGATAASDEPRTHQRAGVEVVAARCDGPERPSNHRGHDDYVVGTVVVRGPEGARLLLYVLGDRIVEDEGDHNRRAARNCRVVQRLAGTPQKLAVTFHKNTSIADEVTNVLMVAKIGDVVLRFD